VTGLVRDRARSARRGGAIGAFFGVEARVKPVTSVRRRRRSSLIITRTRWRRGDGVEMVEVEVVEEEEEGERSLEL